MKKIYIRTFQDDKGQDHSPWQSSRCETICSTQIPTIP